jgi:Pvc16 N-terminal domain
MASSRIVREVTKALTGILQADLGTPPTAILDPNDIRAIPPEDIEDITKNTLIVFLYQVIESPFLKNVGPRSVVGPPNPFPPGGNPVTVQRDPLALDLYYLLIPGAPVDPGEAYLDTYDILGAAMRSFHDHGIFTLGDWVTGVPTDEKDLQFRIDFNRLETADLIRIWEAVHRPYRLSVSYVVRTVQIDSALHSTTGVVSQRHLEVSQI